MGIRGNGKSFLAKALINLLIPPKLFIIDPLDEYRDYARFTCYDAGQCAEAFLSDSFPLRLASASPIDMSLAFELVREINDLFVVVDESDFFLDNQHNPPAFSWSVRYGRHFGQGGILIARRPSNLPREFTAQSVLFFQVCIEPNDLKYIRERVGSVPERLPAFNWYCSDLDGKIIIVSDSWILERQKGFKQCQP